MKSLGSLALLCAFVAPLFLSAGCADLQARGVSRIQIDQQALAAPAHVRMLDANQLSEAEQLALLRSDSSLMRAWAGTKTTNWFAYAFGDKTIFVNQPRSDQLDGLADAFERTVEFVTAAPGTQPASQPSSLGYYIRRNADDFLRVKAMLDGTATPESAHPVKR